MANEPEPADVKTIWQNQSVEGTTMSLEEIRKKVGQLEKKLRMRQRIMWPVVLIVMAGEARILFRGVNLVEGIGVILTIIGTGYIAYQLLLIGKRPAKAIKGETEPPASATFYRTELERQRDFHRGLWFWSRLVILAPGPLVYFIGETMAHPEEIQRIHRTLAVFVVLVILAVPLNLRQARKYQREIDALDR